MAKLADDARLRALYCRRERMKVNYDAWKLRCRIEQLPDAVSARQYSYQAQEALKQGRLDSTDEKQPGARQLFEKGFAAWKRTLAAWPALKEDFSFMADVSTAARTYRQRILKGRPLLDDFPLKQEIEQWDHWQGESLEEPLKH